MGTLSDSMNEYRRQLEKGAIQEAYRGLMKYIMDLKTTLKSKYPEYSISGSIYSGYMDMTYFSFNPETLKQHGLKIAIVFLHQEFRFEVWLAGYNKQVQEKYWKLLKDSNWKKYHLVSTTQGADAILEHILVADPDFGDLAGLTNQIERGTLSFIQDVESFLTQN